MLVLAISGKTQINSMLGFGPAINNGNINMLTKKIMIIPLLFVFNLTGCTRSISDFDDHGEIRKVVFPSLSTSTKNEGVLISRSELKKIRTGMTKSQVYDVLGVPHFREGVLKVKEWDYILNIVRDDNTIATCRMKMIFNSSLKVNKIITLPYGCMKEKNNESKSISKILNASASFEFGSEILNSIGKNELDKLVEQIQNENVDLNASKIYITGYTDIIGNKKDNYQLSFARASAVKKYMMEKGFPSNSMFIKGEGDKDPLVECNNISFYELVNCLAPNRRVLISLK